MNEDYRRIEHLNREVLAHAHELLDGREGNTRIVRKIAGRTGHCERQVWRYVEQLRVDPQHLPKRDRFLLTDTHVEFIGAARGNIEGARKHLLRIGVEVPSESTFRRATLEQLGKKQLAAFKSGARGIRAMTVYLSAADYPRCVRWEMDHTEMGLRVFDEQTGNTTDEVYLTTVLDTGTRVLLGWTVTIGRPDQVSVRQALIRALYGFRIDGGERLGGVPEVIVWDRGPEFLSELVTQTCNAFMTLGIPLPSYSPMKKGRIERWYRSLKQEFIDFLPANKRGPTDVTGKHYNEGDYLRFEYLLAELESFIDFYNFERPHGSLNGRTPFQTWRDDPHPLEIAPPSAIYDAMIKVDKPRQVTNKGVHFKSRVFVPFLPRTVRGSARIRYLPNALESIELFDTSTGRHLGVAIDENVMGERDRARLLELRRTEDREAHAVRRRTEQNRRARFAASGHLVTPTTSNDEPEPRTLTAKGAMAYEELLAAAAEQALPEGAPSQPAHRDPEQLELI